ncbi:MAG TPA: alpha/beta fold hydrolase [Sphingobium sp.]|nr:alpha/beta fold hydrolase [Sphingobium sp.]
MNETFFANDHSPAEILADFERRAQRFETPCGDGAMVWRAWGSGPPLLVIHGAHGAWSHWVRNIDALAASRTVWAIDLPGNGDSAMPTREDFAAISEAIGDGLRALVGPELPIDVAGFSFGGVAAGYLAFHQPDVVRRLILIGTGGLGTPGGAIQLQRLRGLEGEERRAAQRANLLGLMLHHPDSVDELALHLQAANGPRGRLNPRSLVLPDRLLEVLPRLTVRVDAIWGEHDRPHPDPALQEAVMRRSHPDMEFHVIPGAGHWVMYERPQAFNRVLLDLLGRH